MMTRPRRVVSTTGKRWLVALVIFVLAFASIAYMQNDNPGGLTAAIDWEKESYSWLRRLRNDIEEVPAKNHPEPQPPGTDWREQEHILSDSGGKHTDPPELCSATAGNRVNATFDVSEMIYSLKMADLNWDGDVGVWDADIELKFQNLKAEQQKTMNSPTKFAKQKSLKVIVVPFSHSDPGWLMTVDQYLDTYTKSTLDLVLERLVLWPDMTFIWAETSFFQLWWSKLSEEKKTKVKKLVQEGRLEIVNGGYVMPDEATCHYYAILHQYVYGHQWLLKNLNTTPKHGFSIDPFGYSSTMPYILKNLGFESMFIQRIHYVIRKQLLHSKASQFMWQQPWDTNNSDAMFCYLSHAPLYDIRHTCGVDTTQCLQFDFQMGGNYDNVTVVEPAKTLLEQFRKTAHFYPHNVILFPIGMDFRWTSVSEWDSKHHQFRMLMDHLNEDPTNNIEMQFGTYADYYKEVFTRTGHPKNVTAFPSVVGDFFPYADRTVEYWTGYFTSHPFQKALSRDLESHLRAAEMLYVIAKLRGREMDSKVMLKALEEAAKSLGLFQHHDAITGTSKQAVSDDYERRLHEGIVNTYQIIEYVASALFWPNSPDHEMLILHTQRSDKKDLPARRLQLLKEFNGAKRVVVFNSLPSQRHSVIELLIDTENVMIKDSHDNIVSYQVSPVLSQSNVSGALLDAGLARIIFFAHFKSVALEWFTITAVSALVASTKGQHLTKMTTKASGGYSFDKPLILQNAFLRATFSPSSGLLETIARKHGNHLHERSVRLEFKRYETAKSGAYLFWPNGIADMVPYPHDIRILEGPLYSEIQVSFGTALRHIVRLFNTTDDAGRYLEIENTHDLQAESNVELVMRFSTDVKNNFTFFTDSNGFQMIRRRASQDLPMQANYFPATSMAFLQDKDVRLTIHMAEAHGVASQDVGQLEVMLDRTLAQDDARGVEETLKDSRIVRTVSRIQMEMQNFCRTCRNANPTSLANRISLDLNNPAMVLISSVSGNETVAPVEELAQLMGSVPCNTHLVMMKPVDYDVKNNKVGLMLHRLGVDCDGEFPDETDSKICRLVDTLTLPKLLNTNAFDSYNRTTFNFIDVQSSFKKEAPIAIENQKIVALTFSVEPKLVLPNKDVLV